jgi:hypothetical protein
MGRIRAGAPRRLVVDVSAGLPLVVPGLRGRLVSAARVLACRVDWLTAAFRVDLAEPMMRHFGARLSVAEDAERCSVILGGSAFELKRMRTGKRMLLRNADVAIALDPEGPGGWTVAIDVTGGQMIGAELDAVVRTMRHLAAALGDVKGERVRRLDLCADVEHFDVGAIDAAAWVKPSRARLERASLADVDTEAPIARQFRRGQKITGYSICPGNVMQAVIYDKREELGIRPHKRDAEEAIWIERGWDRAAPVGRVEFRFRSEVLHELGARDGLDAFREKLDAIWAYASRWWLRLVELGTHSRVSSCKVTEEWRVVQSVRFKHEAQPAARKRIRKGASPGQVFGACLSAVAGAALLLGSVSCTDVATGRELDEQEIAARLPPAAQESALRSIVSGIVAEAGGLVVNDLLERFGAGRALAWALLRQNAARARFSSCTPPPAVASSPAEVAA